MESTQHTVAYTQSSAFILPVTTGGCVAVRHARSINACGLIGPSIPLRYVSTELSQLHPECYRGRYLWFGRRGIDPGGWEGPDP